MSNKIVTFLEKAGSEILKVGSVVTGIQPYLTEAGQIVSAIAPNAAGTVTKVESEIAAMLGVVTTVEAVGQAVTSPLTGPQKLQAAIPLVGQVISGSAAMVGKKIANPALYAQAMQEFAQASADLANSLEANTVSTT